MRLDVRTAGSMSNAAMCLDAVAPLNKESTMRGMRKQ